MAKVTLHPIGESNREACLELSVSEEQKPLVASNRKSLEEAKGNPTLYPFAIYDEMARGWVEPKVPMVGFAMYEIAAGVGFIFTPGA